MYQKAKALFMICETPLHAGSGDSLGIVDMPIQRERHTSYPKIEASSLKGALRAFFEQKKNVNYEKNHNTEEVVIAFGSEGSGDTAGALGFTDARLLLFPVKSMKGTFAWITCPRALRQFARDMERTDEKLKITDIPDNPGENECYFINAKSTLNVGDNKVILEEYAFSAGLKEVKVNGDDFGKWIAEHLFAKYDYWKGKAENDIVILNDDDFKDFVNLSTEVITRTRIDNATGTVAKGALFTEEYLPAESVMYSLVLASPEFISDKELAKKNRERFNADKNMRFFTDLIKAEKSNVFQLGGNSTLGKGILRAKLLANSENNSENG